MRKIVLLAVVAASTLRAQQPLALTLADAERTALQNNPQLSEAQNIEAASNQVPLELRANFLPTLTGAVTGVGASDGRLAAGALNNPVVYSRLAAGVMGSQLVTDFGRTRDLVDSAKLKAQAEQQATETARADILLATVRAYYTLLRANSVLTVAQQTVTARQLVVDQVNALANSNLKSQLDVSFAKVNLADAQLLLSQYQNAVKAAEADLADALGLPNQISFVVQDEPPPPALADSVDALVAQALQDRPELKDLRLEQSAAERQVAAEHALKYPTVSAAASVGVVPVGQAPVPGKYGAVGVNLSIPILNGGLFRAREAEAALRAKAASDKVSDLANRITRDARVAYLNARTAFERVGLTDEFLKQAASALDLARGRYDLGLSSIVELSQAQLNLTTAQIGNASARYEYQALRAVLDFEVGALR